MLPKFGQARAQLECETGTCCLWARSAFEHRIPQPPAPRGLEQIGPENFASDRAPKSRFKQPATSPAFLLPTIRRIAFEPAPLCAVSDSSISLRGVMPRAG